jgi:quinol monooxygenase YgiN
MIGICAKLPCQPGKNEAFEKALVDFVNTVRANEPGALTYQLCRSKTDPNMYFMLEIYADAEALAAHGKTAHMQALLPVLGPLLGGAPELIEGPAVN